jgi:hypothetical protein
MNKPQPQKFIFYIYLLLAASTMAVFWQVRNFDFVNYDDNFYVYQNPHVLNGLTTDGAIWAFATPHVGNWLPLTWISFMFDCQLFGSNPGWMHLINLLLHLANTLLLFAILKKNNSRRMAERICRRSLCPSSDACRIGRVDYRAQRCAEHIVSDAYIGRLCHLCQTPQPGSLSADNSAVYLRSTGKANACDRAVYTATAGLLAAEPFYFTKDCKGPRPPSPQNGPRSQQSSVSNNNGKSSFLCDVNGFKHNYLLCPA